MKNKSTKITIIIIFLIVIVVGYYAYLSNKDRERKEEATMTAVQDTLSRSMEMKYPNTPKEVIKYYNEILDCFYNEECTEEEIEALGNRARELYDDELLANNEPDDYFVNLKEDVQEFKDKKRSITSVSLASSTNVDLFEEDGYEFARIMCEYNIMENGVNHPSSQVYLLRRDAEDRWKIYGWESVEKYNQRNVQAE